MLLGIFNRLNVLDDTAENENGKREWFYNWSRTFRRAVSGLWLDNQHCQGDVSCLQVDAQIKGPLQQHSQIPAQTLLAVSREDKNFSLDYT